MLPVGCSRRLVAELQGALDTCAERQRQLERDLRVSRRLLRTWEPAEIPAPEPTPGPETHEKALSPVCTPSPQDLKELELLTQALEKAVHVRKGISKAEERDKASSLKSRSIATSATTVFAPTRASQTKSPRDIRQTTMPAKGLPKPRLLSTGEQTCIGRGPQAAKTGRGLRDQQIALSTAPQAPEAFTLKEKGTLLQLPMAFRKVASQNSRLWAQLSSTQTGDSMDVTTSSKTQFLQKMQMTSGWPSTRLSAAEIEAEVGRLQKACLLLRLRMGEELTKDPTDWMQEYRCLLTLEGLQANVGQCLQRLQKLRSEVVEQQLGPRPERRLPTASLPCGGGADPIWSPQLLLYSSTQELQTLAALRLRVCMLDQQIHLEKVLMAELLPLVSTQESLGPPWLALCRAVHSLLCEGGQRFLTILRDEPAY
ncbi:tubulin epsilon and delta complex protein 2 [Molossus molossus]|uniref:Tubulin epsilon and delta complex 2 n=2 Tax=Molossus molossus TaxID=27622 RepID=A0A7J8J477_MOLMO|nr:tubulin epsilon and delta complex protein 2 [Molossus molossus]KAF6491209.1 tubulin epsilon and delta complex 2 [Molossus molossus]